MEDRREELLRVYGTSLPNMRVLVLPAEEVGLWEVYVRSDLIDQRIGSIRLSEAGKYGVYYINEVEIPDTNSTSKQIGVAYSLEAAGRLLARQALAGRPGEDIWVETGKSLGKLWPRGAATSQGSGIQQIQKEGE